MAALADDADDADVVVLGGGPAGRAVAAACAREGLGTVLADPAPERAWRSTYALWRDEVPSLPDTAVAATASHVLAAGTVVGREFTVLDNAGLRDWLTEPGVTAVAGTATGVAHGRYGSIVRLADGRRLAASVVVDARGTRPGGTEQTAFGLVLPERAAAGLAPAGTPVFMDWARSPADEPGFLYVVPLGGGRVLVEETSLARRPGLPFGVLRGRLAARGFDVAAHPAEQVRIRLDPPVPRPGRTVPFGARAGLVHPATGFSVAASLALAPRVAAALADGLRAGPDAAARAAWRAIWSPRALAVHALRRHALRALLRLPPRDVPGFFSLFFALPCHRQRAFTSGRDDVAGTAAAMAELFAAVPWRLRPALVR
ncbi:lycopene cyclase family protein [Prauserella muralis]|uniref:Lycopene cyclase n=1 Tax=Prauserella muralis TaxID=588067 RepID=A0A2V4AIV0_9PSEU|nr:lycopene cyclase family protein [Prauserella muralis]PXY19106.1 lycopene cyclase [Prauserella muralis]TWE29010.1 lycopene cyclase (CrtL-type) [Prauserella muralis]